METNLLALPSRSAGRVKTVVQFNYKLNSDHD